MIAEARQTYIKKLFEGYGVIYITYIRDDQGHFIEMCSLRNNEGQQALIYCDMTDVYENLKSNGGDTKKKITKLEESYMTIEIN